MTFENDPNRPDTDTLPQQPTRNVARRDGSGTVLPLVLGALAIVLAGYMFFGDRFSAPDRTPGIEQPAPKTN
jgi:hypothetical protein